MPAANVDEYLAELDEPKRSTLQAMRQMLLEIEPELQETIGWGAPIFKLKGKNVAGLCAFKNHLTFSPQSADVMAAHESELAGFVVAKSSLQFAVDQPLPKALLASLVKARIAELG
ncbi:MAG: DUF1801 domain-containing protein [Actinomycetales bacterium]|nr:DUF1801 domain-containing protein [Actinomycetales bacterium]